MIIALLTIAITWGVCVGWFIALTIRQHALLKQARNDNPSTVIASPPPASHSPSTPPAPPDGAFHVVPVHVADLPQIQTSLTKLPSEYRGQFVVHTMPAIWHAITRLKGRPEDWRAIRCPDELTAGLVCMFVGEVYGRRVAHQQFMDRINNSLN